MTDLFNYRPPLPRAAFDGVTYSAKRDQERLHGQLERVFDLMRDGQWRTLSAIARHTQGSEAGVSARLRDIRKPKFGGRTVERRYIADGKWEYRMLVSEGAE